jgi:hypothetical protein
MQYKLPSEPLSVGVDVAWQGLAIWQFVPLKPALHDVQVQEPVVSPMSPPLMQ